MAAKQIQYINKINLAVEYTKALEKRKEGDGAGRAPLLRKGGVGMVGQLGRTHLRLVLAEINGNKQFNHLTIEPFNHIIPDHRYTLP